MKFTTPPNKDYKQDIIILKNAIENGEYITFSKFCDGEWAVLENKQINNKEFWFDPNNPLDQNKRKKLLEAFQYNNERYYVGVACPNVFGIDTHKNMKLLCGLPEYRLTWADIWVNSNYKYFLDNIIPIFKQREILLFCNEKGNIKNLPFNPYIVFPVSNNAWEYNWKHIDIAKFIIANNKIKNAIILFCCGPFGNILAYELTKEHPENIYLDIGSTLNPWLKSASFERDYYMGNNYFSNMVGSWCV